MCVCERDYDVKRVTCAKINNKITKIIFHQQETIVGRKYQNY